MADLSFAIKNEQEKILQRVSGIGQKLAARIILELKNSKKLNATKLIVTFQAIRGVHRSFACRKNMTDIARSTLIAHNT